MMHTCREIAFQKLTKPPENWLSQTDIHLPMYGIFPYIYVPYKSKKWQVIIDHIEMYHKIEQHAGFIDRIERLG